MSDVENFKLQCVETLKGVVDTKPDSLLYVVTSVFKPRDQHGTMLISMYEDGHENVFGVESRCVVTWRDLHQISKTLNDILLASDKLVGATFNGMTHRFYVPNRIGVYREFFGKRDDVSATLLSIGLGARCEKKPNCFRSQQGGALPACQSCGWFEKCDGEQ